MRNFLLLIALSFVCLSPVVAQAGEPREDWIDRTKRFFYAGNEALTFLKNLDDLSGGSLRQNVRGYFERRSSGYVDATQYKQLLEKLEQKVDNQEYVAVIRDLRMALNDRMKYEEAYALVNGALAKVDQKLAALARRIDEHQQTLYAHQRLLMQFENDIDTLFKGQKDLFKGQKDLSGKIDDLRTETGFETSRLSGMMGGLKGEFDELRRDYPKWKPEEQGEQLAVAGFQLLLKGNAADALRTLRYAHAYDPGEPCYLYYLAIALRRDGKKEDAETYLARGVAAERKRPLSYSRVWKNLADRFQGAERTWIENARSDAVFGVFVPGMIYVPDGVLSK